MALLDQSVNWMQVIKWDLTYPGPQRLERGSKLLALASASYVIENNSLIFLLWLQAGGCPWILSTNKTSDQESALLHDSMIYKYIVLQYHD